MTLYVITGNKHKFEEISKILPLVEQLDLDLPEIQSIDAKEIIQAKLNEALKHKQAEFIVEDTSLYLESLNGLPGPLIKWFMKTIGNEGLSNLAYKLGNTKAEAKTLIGYVDSSKQVHYFEGSIKGNIIFPKGQSTFGWDTIFQPEGYSKSFAELTKKEKNEISMRRKALNNLKEFMNIQR